MGVFPELKDLFESIFLRSSPEVQKKQMLKKMDAEICQFQPLICKNGMLQPNFGEAVFTLYKNVHTLDALFSKTILLLSSLSSALIFFLLFFFLIHLHNLYQ